jgi:hypothetical protein
MNQAQHSTTFVDTPRCSRTLYIRLSNYFLYILNYHIMTVLAEIEWIWTKLSSSSEKFRHTALHQKRLTKCATRHNHYLTTWIDHEHPLNAFLPSSTGEIRNWRLQVSESIVRQKHAVTSQNLLSNRHT